MRDDDEAKRGALSRRGFLGTGPLVGLAGACKTAPSAPATTIAHFDLTGASAALEPDTVVDSACQFCNSLCRIKVEKKAGRVIAIRGEPADPVQAGNLCVKAPMMRELVYNRHRVKQPMKRVSGRKGDPASGFAPISWDEALGGIASTLLRIRDEGAPEAVASKTTGRMARGAGSIIGRFFELYGSPNATDVGPVCNDAGGNALAATFGLGNFTNGYGVDGATGHEDLGASRYLLMFGTNQAETHPVTFEYLLRARAKTGAKLVVIDPRKTPTGALADRHVAIRPHTDLALAYGMIATILEENLHDAAFVERWVVGFPELRAHVKAQGFSAAWASRMTDVPAEVIRALAREYARARPAAIFCNAGISHQMNAFHTYRALAFLAAITGNIGAPGGGCNFMHNTWPGGLELPPLEGGPAPARKQALPVGPDAFAASVLDGRPYKLRAVFAVGNQLVDSANTARVRAAYEQLELFVYPALFMEEPAAYADYILPVTSVLEMDCVYMRRDDRAIRWCNQAVSPVGEARPDIEIWLGLAAKMAELDRKHPPTYWTNNLRAEWKDYRLLWDEVFVKRTAGMAGMTSARLKNRAEPLRWPCPSPEHPGVSTLYLEHPSWQEAAAALGHPGKRFLTPSGKIEIATPALEKRLAGAGHAALPPFYSHPETTGDLPTASHSQELVENPIHPGTLTPKATLGVPANRPAGFPLVGMIGRPSVAHFATMTHWLASAEQLNGIRLIQIHPRTAGAAKIANGDTVRVESPRGAVTGTALLFDGIREDTIFVPNTFGPAQRVAEENGLPLYEPANLLLDDRYFDNLSGQQAYKCFACRVVKA
jgi:formate dehydrogenase (coenzyme F420) alpha subunit